MLLTNTLKVKIINLNVDFYKLKGYKCKIGDTIKVKTEDTSKHSKQKVDMLCDVCETNKESITIKKYFNCKDTQYVCKECRKKDLDGRKCDICGDTFGVSDYLEKGQLLCNRHKKQMRRHGCIGRTINDKNEIRLYKDYAEFDTYDRSGNVNGTFKIDLDVINFIKTHKCHKHHDGYATYKTEDGKNIRLHRKIMGVENILDEEKYVDHINRDRSDNRKYNLRLVSQTTNNRNVGMYSHNTSGYKGISFSKSRNKWEVYIHTNNRKINLGLYTDLNRAIKVREMAELTYFGEDSPNYNELIKKYFNK